jgi:uncharacterized membrane protein YhiD involved in acid resistance
MNLHFSTIAEQYFDLAQIGSSVQTLVINVLVLLAMSLIISFLYTKTASTLSNRKTLAAIFPLLSVVTMMVISVIKSSLALSLGLVGALSIIRFRSAIKEPEELTYIFLAISLGLGMGAEQQALTLVFFILICVYIIVKYFLQKNGSLFKYQQDQSLYLTLQITNQKLNLDRVIQILDDHCHFIELKRLDEDKDKREMLFVIKTKDYHQLLKIKTDLSQVDPQIKISILNDEQLFF